MAELAIDFGRRGFLDFAVGGPIAGAIGRSGGSYRDMSEPRAFVTMSPRVAGWALGTGLACGPLLLLALGPWLLTGREIVEFDTVDVLYRDVADRVGRGQVPYRDFPLEYPIGSLPQILLPRLAGGGVSAYRTAYVAEMLLANALLLLAVAGFVERSEGREAVPRRLAWYLVCYLFLCRLMAGRLDVVPALLAFVSAAAWSGDRPIRGGTLAALGALVKVFPALAVLPAGLAERSVDGGSRPRGLIAFAVVLAPGLAAWAVLGGPGMLDSILFHAERGLEIESVGAGLLMLAGRLTGASMAVETAHGSIELDSPWSPTAVAASRYLSCLALALTLLPFARSDRRSGVRCTGALLVAVMATAPVLSPQFLIWILPFAMAAEGLLGRRIRPLFALSCALTFLIYPVLFVPALLPMRIAAILVLNLRNALLIALWGLMAFGTETGTGHHGGRYSVEVDDRLAGP